MVRTFAKAFGIVYLIAGISGFIPGLMQPAGGAPELAIEAGYGILFGIFPVNLVHNLIHIGIGIWGILAARSALGAVTFARANTVIFALLFLLGIIPATHTLFGLAPIYGIAAWLHLLSAAIAAYFGFAGAARVHARHTQGPTAIIERRLRNVPFRGLLSGLGRSNQDDRARCRLRNGFTEIAVLPLHDQQTATGTPHRMQQVRSVERMDGDKPHGRALDAAFQSLPFQRLRLGIRLCRKRDIQAAGFQLGQFGGHL